MDKNKLQLGLLFGGKSGEHEVSLLSASSVYQALNKEKYNIKLIAIDKDGQWKCGAGIQKTILNPSDPNKVSLASNLTTINFHKDLHNIDVIFPILHGTYGEDGAIQGMFEILDKAYVGAGILGSAIGMDKDIMKSLLQHANILVAKFKILKENNYSESELFEIIEYLLFPIFVKPANLGSSVGVSKAHTVDELKESIRKAFMFDTKVILEEFIKGRELEVSALGTNTNPKVSIVGEVKPHHEFYSYESKYTDENGAHIHIPAQIPEIIKEDIQKIAKKAFTELACDGMCRADFFYGDNGKVYLNEINTIPGFTTISMYPKLWEASGLGYSELLDELITLAIERKRMSDRLVRDFKKQ